MWIVLEGMGALKHGPPHHHLGDEYVGDKTVSLPLKSDGQLADALIKVLPPQPYVSRYLAFQ